MSKPVAGLLMFVAILICSSLGCKSTTSFIMQRFDDDKIVANSNGDAGIHGEALPFRGVPVTLKVATHVDIKIMETLYYDKNNFELIDTKRNLHAKANPVYSDKIFSVDPKKAAAGNTDFVFEFDSDNTDKRHRQYFKKITQKITDDTIKDLKGALDSILPLLAPPKPENSKRTDSQSAFTRNDSPVIVKERCVAFKRFDINSVDFEDQVRIFVENHINNCANRSPIGCGPCDLQH